MAKKNKEILDIYYMSHSAGLKSFACIAHDIVRYFQLINCISIYICSWTKCYVFFFVFCFLFFILVREKKGKTSTRAVVFDVTHTKNDGSFLNDDIVDKVVCV
jgi:hypothetical protein